MRIGILRRKPGFNSALGVLFAILAGLLLLGYLSHLLRGRDGGPQVSVTVATRDVQPGQAIEPEAIATRRIPKDYVVPGTLQSRDKVSGNRALRFIARGEPFTGSSVSGGGSQTLAAQIPADLRAYCLRLDGNPGAGPELRPGDRVDVLETAGEPPRTGTLLVNRQVLSTGGQGSAGDGESRSGSGQITILVSPREAEMLAQAECEGQVSVSLCPLGGTTTAP